MKAGGCQLSLTLTAGIQMTRGGGEGSKVGPAGAAAARATAVALARLAEDLGTAVPHERASRCDPPIGALVLWPRLDCAITPIHIAMPPSCRSLMPAHCVHGHSSQRVQDQCGRLPPGSGRVLPQARRDDPARHHRQGPAFHSAAFAQACLELGIAQKFTRAYRLQSNGKAERFI